ncbi:glycosyltransferase family 4 protein [Gracilibacillus caseinilyticus]|uniref:Glycosyltransferase family 4 protein n=1 Tax=Gracilibacillus caseinilyticus TaxID=2932256 RepID=A0ABY4EWJ8_9BACI|nr:glycosyltransferase family 4 protein [Gracilibacillus caseinilyticus]UOQ48613.1 glycosyltransferase family 4 protein [Gracilibacillus caseinilyticus]
MKILLATFWAVPHVGGVWNYMMQLKDQYEQQGHQVDLMGFNEGNTIVHIWNKQRQIEKNAIQDEVQTAFAIREKQSSAIQQDQYVRYYELQRCIYEIAARKLDITHYDLIHTQDVISSACINRIRPDTIPQVSSIHGSAAQELKDAVTRVFKSPTAEIACRYFDEMEKEGAMAAEYTIVANHWLKRIFMKEYQIPKNKLRVLHYGYDIETFIQKMSEKTEIERPADKKLILFTGRIIEKKGVYDLVEALRILKKEYDGWVCWIVGEGPDRNDLQEKVKQYGLQENVYFFGNRRDIPYLLSLADIFVLPSQLDNQPLSVIEAQLAGKAIITSNAGGLPEMVQDGKTGLITRMGNSQHLFEQMKRLLEDPLLREHLGKNVREWALKHWKINKAIKKVFHIYQEAIKKKERAIKKDN